MTFDELPAAFPGQRCYGTIVGKRQFVIVEDHAEFTASFRKLGRSTTHHLIDYDHRVKSFEEAKAACEAALHEQ